MTIQIRSRKVKKLKKTSRSKIFVPWIVFCMYIYITLLLSFIGPWEYLNYNKLLVFVFMTAFLFCGTIAYYYAIKKPVVKKILYENKISLLLKFSIIFSFILYLWMLFNNVRSEGLPEDFSLSDWTTIMAAAYTSSVSESYSFDLAVWIYSYFSIFTVIAMVMGVYVFKQLPNSYKFMVIGIYFINIVNSMVYIGAQKALGDMLIYLISVIALKFCSGQVKFRLKTVIVFSILVFTAVYSFMLILGARLTYWNISVGGSSSLAWVDSSNFLLRFLPENIKAGFLQFLIYASSGYYGLSLSLQLPFQWSMGFGSSFAINDILTRVLTIDATSVPLSYPDRMEIATGWSARANWNTIFPWLASDFTFIGSIVFLCIIIYFYARSFKKALINNDMLSILFFTHFNILLFYVPANNQLFQTRASLVVTLILIFAIFKKKVRLKESTTDLASQQIEPDEMIRKI
ncbi:hypothetical protein LIS77_22925 [Cytobacillus firmus]|uniref:hypothetical protein n=1 Tax=Cytobacillus firmus TaxID=1399 RepID=UPI002079A167|nr:hypothetical protein [Cytobacillus firmus]USK38702.1 hypothetical protein LIS77_22925 [Cytobacillus firmus]